MDDIVERIRNISFTPRFGPEYAFEGAGSARETKTLGELMDSFKSWMRKDEADSGADYFDFKRHKIPYNDSTISHIFREAEGHIPDTPENRALLENVANNSQNFLGKDKYGNEWYTQNLDDGRQVWVESRNGNIFEGGFNDIPKEWNSATGLKKP